MADKQGWAIAQGETHDGQPMLLRIKQYEDAFPRARYEHRLNIVWPVAAGSVDGMPDQADMDAMQVFENRLCAAIEADSQATLGLVITGAGEREWVFYCRDAQEFMQRLSAMPHDGAPYPIRIEYERDPDWEFFRDYLPGSDATE
jgi:hypothetical protein